VGILGAVGIAGIAGILGAVGIAGIAGILEAAARVCSARLANPSFIEEDTVVAS
jgi:hypothetical protein